MSPNSRKERYPYSKNRVILSAVIALLSTILALALLLRDTILMLYYFLAMILVAIVTFFLKKRFYPLLIAEKLQVEPENKLNGASWKTLLLAFFMLIGFIAVPLLLAGFLSASLWFIMITSFTSGVSISEIALYIQASRILEI